MKQENNITDIDTERILNTVYAADNASIILKKYEN